MRIVYSLGRVLQFAGLIILPIAISGNVAGKLDLKESLTWSSAGMAAFIVGWGLQQFSQPK